MIYAGVEGGGTKFVCAVAESPDRVLEETTVPTADPQSTLAACVEFFAAAERRHGPIASFGVACFGPIEIARQRADFGRMMQTPKAGWSGVDVLEPLRARFAAPIGLDTDVGAAALAELRLGAGRDVDSVAYVTVGTGIGGGIAPWDRERGKLMHAEMGHLKLRRDPRDDGFAGSCPFHGDCLEGLASGTAIRARWGRELGELPDDHAAWPIVGGYLGRLAASIALMVSVERILFGGGVMANGRLLPFVRAAAHEALNGYLPPLANEQCIEDYIRAPALRERAGIAGALLLAMDEAAP